MYIAELYSHGWISAADSDLNGQYDYNVLALWFIRTDDDNNNILFRLIYLDIEESPSCINDFLTVQICEVCF